uniref:Uncharacterized protein n=1 Tax=Anguilla anguilla TaxID=7936 RepID=A0A0E9PD53_ANGAN
MKIIDFFNLVKVGHFFPPFFLLIVPSDILQHWPTFN